MAKVVPGDFLRILDDEGMPPIDTSDEAMAEEERLEKQWEKEQAEKIKAPDRHEFQREGDEEEWWTFNQFQVKMSTKERIVISANEKGVSKERYLRFLIDDYHSIV